MFEQNDLHLDFESGNRYLQAAERDHLALEMTWSSLYLFASDWFSKSQITWNSHPSGDDWGGLGWNVNFAIHMRFCSKLMWRSGHANAGFKCNRCLPFWDCWKDICPRHTRLLEETLQPGLFWLTYIASYRKKYQSIAGQCSKRRLVLYTLVMPFVVELLSAKNSPRKCRACTCGIVLVVLLEWSSSASRWS